MYHIIFCLLGLLWPRLVMFASLVDVTGRDGMQLGGILTKCSKGKDTFQLLPFQFCEPGSSHIFSCKPTTQFAHLCPLHCEISWKAVVPTQGVPDLIYDEVSLNTHILIVVVINFKPQPTARLYETKCSVLMKRWETQAVQAEGR